jgi:hypothetical protein
MGGQNRRRAKFAQKEALEQVIVYKGLFISIGDVEVYQRNPVPYARE